MSTINKVGYTPGPWKVVEHTPESASVRIDEDCLISGAYLGGESDTLTVANARLIAAAPELLESAKDALESLKRLPNTEGAYRITVIQELQAAIAKAEGRN